MSTKVVYNWVLASKWTLDYKIIFYFLDKRSVSDMEDRIQLSHFLFLENKKPKRQSGRASAALHLSPGDYCGPRHVVILTRGPSFTQSAPVLLTDKIPCGSWLYYALSPDKPIFQKYYTCTIRLNTFSV